MIGTSTCSAICLMARFPVTRAMAAYNAIEFDVDDPAVLLTTDRMFRKLEVLDCIDALLTIVPHDEIQLRNGALVAAVLGDFKKDATMLRDSAEV
jgi:hypothetical protein